MKTIIYESNTGTAKKYAEALAKREQINCFALSESESVSPDNEIIFIGWVMAGEIQGLKVVREKFENVKTVVSVGIMKSDKQDIGIKEKNAITENYYSLPGSFDMKKLKGMYKMMMGMMVRMMKSKLKENPGESLEKAIGIFENGFDGYDEGALDSVLV